MRGRASLAGAALVIGSLGLTSCGDDSFDVADAPVTQRADYFYEIPLGAGEALDRGEPLEVLPGELTTSVGEVIEIVNHDDRGHLIGPFFVGAHETLRQRFSSAGEFVGICTVHPSGELLLTVVE